MIKLNRHPNEEGQPGTPGLAFLLAITGMAWSNSPSQKLVRWGWFPFLPHVLAVVGITPHRTELINTNELT